MSHPVPVRVANCASVSTGPRRAANVFRSALTRPGPFGFPRVVLACEASDFDATLEAEKMGWDAAQFTENSADAGSAVAWDPRYAALIGSPRLLPGTPAGEGIRARSLVQVKLDVSGHRARFAAGHAPPDRAPRGQQAYLDQIRAYRGVIGLDSNRWPGEVTAGGYHRTYLGVALLGMFVPGWIPTSDAARVDLVQGETYDDHPAVDVLLWSDKRHGIPLP